MACTIATRKSPLALAQADIVRDALIALESELAVSILGLRTEGDQRLSQPLAQIGGKGLFIREIEQALLQQKADIAVHSLKDMPVDTHPDLPIVAFMPADDPFDVLVSHRYESLEQMPQEAIIGTSSLRRSLVLRRYYAKECVQSVRGNVGTRLKKMEQGQYDALILAAAGLKRLGLGHRIQARLPRDRFVPAAGQGVICIQVHRENTAYITKLKPIGSHKQQRLSSSERRVLRELGGSCELPIGVHAHAIEDEVQLSCLIGAPDFSDVIHEKLNGTLPQLDALTDALIHRVIARGALHWIQQLKNSHIA